MTEDAEVAIKDPSYHTFLPGICPLGFIFTRVEASRVLNTACLTNPGSDKILLRINLKALTLLGFGLF